MTGGYYVGSMATAGVCQILKLKYGGPGPSIEDAIDKACKHTVDEVFKYLKHYIERMRAHPMRKCNACGSIIPV